MKYTYTILLLLFATIHLSAQTVSNIQATFTDCQIEVKYDLTTPNPVNLVLKYSGDGGNTWLPCATISGDITNQNAGNNKLIIWDSQADNIRWGLFEFRVEVPQPPAECVMIGSVCWATRNVGTPGTFVNNPEDLGMLYQWNSKVGWSSTDPLVSTDGSTWNPAWNGNGATTWERANDPCPAGYRMPTQAEWQSLVITPGWQLLINGYSYSSGDNFVYWPAAGYRDSSNGLLSITTYSHYWSSTVGDDGAPLGLNSLFVTYGNNRNGFAGGCSIRCVAE